jgi:hypothetical protein
LCTQFLSSVHRHELLPQRRVDALTICARSSFPLIYSARPPRREYYPCTYNLCTQFPLCLYCLRGGNDVLSMHLQFVHAVPCGPRAAASQRHMYYPCTYNLCTQFSSGSSGQISVSKGIIHALTICARSSTRWISQGGTMADVLSMHLQFVHAVLNSDDGSRHVLVSYYPCTYNLCTQFPYLPRCDLRELQYYPCTYNLCTQFTSPHNSFCFALLYGHLRGSHAHNSHCPVLFLPGRKNGNPY